MRQITISVWKFPFHSSPCEVGQRSEYAGAGVVSVSQAFEGPSVSENACSHGALDTSCGQKAWPPGLEVYYAFIRKRQ